MPIVIEHGENGVRIEGLALRSLANWRPRHWSERARYVAGVRRTVATALHGCVRPSLPCGVTMTRWGTRTLDSDNAITSAKPVRDEIARWLGIDDADPRVTWRVEQAVGSHAVTIAWAAAPSAVQLR